MSKIKNILGLLLIFIFIIGGMMSSCYAKNVELTTSENEKTEDEEKTDKNETREE